MSWGKTNRLDSKLYGYRLHRFPPLAQDTVRGDRISEQEGWEDIKVDVQQRLDERLSGRS